MLTKREICNLEVQSTDLDSLMFIHVQLKNIIDGFKASGWAVPEYLQEKFDVLSDEIEVRLRADKLRQLKLLKLRRGSLSTREEMRASLETQIAALEKSLSIERE